MAAKTNEMVTGEYDHYGKAVIAGDTDSVVGSTMIETSLGKHSIENLFNMCDEKWEDGDKEYSNNSELMVMSYDKNCNEPYFGHTEYIYRHKVTKDLYEIEDQFGNIIVVTEDHSVMVERDGTLTEVKPHEMHDDDILISIRLGDKNESE